MRRGRARYRVLADHILALVYPDVVDEHLHGEREVHEILLLEPRRHAQVEDDILSPPARQHTSLRPRRGGSDEGKLTIIDFDCAEFTDVDLSGKGPLCEVEPDFGRIGTWTAPDAEQNPISGDVYSCGAVITRLMIISCRDDENAKLLKALGMRMQASRFSNRPSLDEVEGEISRLITSEN